MTQSRYPERDLGLRKSGTLSQAALDYPGTSANASGGTRISSIDFTRILAQMTPPGARTDHPLEIIRAYDG